MYFVSIFLYEFSKIPRTIKKKQMFCEIFVLISAAKCDFRLNTKKQKPNRSRFCFRFLSLLFSCVVVRNSLAGCSSVLSCHESNFIELFFFYCQWKLFFSIIFLILAFGGFSIFLIGFWLEWRISGQEAKSD